MHKIINNFLPRKKQRNIFLYNLRIFILAIAIIMIWRWVWNFLDHYIIPEDFILSNIVTICVWVLILFLNDSSLEFLVDPEEDEE